MILDKKECILLDLIKKNPNESIYKIARPIFSVVTINKKLQELKKINIVKVEMIGRINEIKFTEKGMELLKYINKIKMLLLMND